MPSGVQRYTMQGVVNCQTIGNCTAAGSGVIDVFDGATYAVIWQNTGYGTCSLTLSS